MKDKIIEYFDKSSNKLTIQDMQKVGAFVDLAITQTFKQPSDEQLPYLVKQILVLKDYLNSEVNYVSTQKDNKDFIINLFSESEVKKKESELEEEQLNQENLSENDQ